MHVNIWFKFVWPTWLKGLVWEPCMVGKTNQPRWWFMGHGLFLLGKNKTLKPKNPILKGGFHSEGRLLPGAGRHPAGRPKILHLAIMPVSSSSSTRSLYFPRKKNQRGFEGEKRLPAMACQAHVRGQPNYKHRSGLCFRVIRLTPTTEKRCSPIKSGGHSHTSEADVSQSACVGLLALTEPPGDTSRAFDAGRVVI